MIKTILFDFDGTLFDTGEGILRSVQYALEGFGIHETDTARLRKFVGPPLLDSFSELYAMTPEAALMVGDRKYDVTGAAACGVPCLGVYYGYAEPGELEAAGAAAVVQTVAELGERLLHWNEA